MRVSTHTKVLSGFELERAASSRLPALAGGGSRIEVLAANALYEGRYVLPRFVAHTDYQPPDPDVVFVSVCNDKYAPGLEGVILSLKRVYPGLQNRYVVYHDGGLSEFNQKRLRALHSGFEFVLESTEKYRVKLSGAGNHKRVGLLGYLSLAALDLDSASHVVILDSDLLILGDISPLWRGDRVKAVPDIGARPFAVISSVRKRPVLNSGVLSFPRSKLGPEAAKRRQEVLAGLEHDVDHDTERFADQRFWNAYIGDDVELLPQNFNCVKSLVTDYYPDELSRIAVLHVTGPKPWYAFIDSKLVSSVERKQFEEARAENAGAFALWQETHGRELLRARLSAFRKDAEERVGHLRESLGGRPVVLIGNGPSLNQTDLGAFDGYEKFAFNWFVNHAEFDRVRPQHLVLASHMLFGGWHTAHPQLPPEYLEALARHEHKPRLWISYYFKDYVESLEALRGYDIGYFFFEKPFKRPLAKYGRVELDLDQPLVDSNTGVITAAVPIGLWMGAKQFVLVGCDSNYSSTAGSYFYAASSHKSATTREKTLVATWQRGGQGGYGYEVLRRQLEERGVRLHDATIGGSLDMLERLTLDEARQLGALRA